MVKTSKFPVILLPGTQNYFSSGYPGLEYLLCFQNNFKKSESAPRKRHMLTYQYELIGFTMQHVQTVPN